MINRVYYTALRRIMEEDELPHFNDAQYIIPITVLAKDMKVNYSTFKKKMEDPGKMTVRDLAGLSKLIEVDAGRLFSDAIKQMKHKGGKGKAQTTPA